MVGKSRRGSKKGDLDLGFNELQPQNVSQREREKKKLLLFLRVGPLLKLHNCSFTQVMRTL